MIEWILMDKSPYFVDYNDNTHFYINEDENAKQKIILTVETIISQYFDRYHNDNDFPTGRVLGELVLGSHVTNNSPYFIKAQLHIEFVGIDSGLRVRKDTLLCSYPFLRKDTNCFYYNSQKLETFMCIGFEYLNEKSVDINIPDLPLTEEKKIEELIKKLQALNAEFAVQRQKLYSKYNERFKNDLFGYKSYEQYCHVDLDGTMIDLQYHRGIAFSGQMNTEVTETLSYLQFEFDKTEYEGLEGVTWDG